MKTFGIHARDAREPEKCLRMATMSRERDIAFGEHSRLPRCCILFFVNEWEYMYGDDSNPYVRAVSIARWRYVPCPSCLATGNRVDMRICADECGKECWREF